MVSEVARQSRLAQRLVCGSEYAGDLYEIAGRSAGGASNGFVRGAGRQLQYRRQKPVTRVADLELRGVHPHSDTARTGGHVVARECALVLLVQPAVLVERQRVGGNHLAGEQVRAREAGLRTSHRAPRSGWGDPAVDDQSAIQTIICPTETSG